MYTIIEHQTCIYLCIATIEYIIVYNMCYNGSIFNKADFGISIDSIQLCTHFQSS